MQFSDSSLNMPQPPFGRLARAALASPFTDADKIKCGGAGQFQSAHCCP
jgi:hypothetical protein